MSGGRYPAQSRATTGVSTCLCVVGVGVGGERGCLCVCGWVGWWMAQFTFRARNDIICRVDGTQLFVSPVTNINIASSLSCFVCIVYANMLHELHWLPVDKRLHYKILALAYQSFNLTAPAYLNEFAPRHQTQRVCVCV
jgi:hypothetical protein